MKKQILMAAVAGFCLMAATAAMAEEAPIAAPQPAPITDQLSPEQAEKLEAFKNMSPEERQSFVEQRREDVKNMTPEEKEAFKEERKQAFQSMTPEEKQELKQKFKDRRGGFRNRGAAGE
jgi:hypothetical protein